MLAPFLLALALLLTAAAPFPHADAEESRGGATKRLVPPAHQDIQLVTTAVPFPRGLVIQDDTLYLLARGRVRGAGGVSASIDDQAGTIYQLDLDALPPDPSAPVPSPHTNAQPLARPTSPPFRLWDRKASPPEADRDTDRPYCTLRYHAPTRSFYLCAFSGIDKATSPQDPVAFSKNRTDAILRYDLRTRKWYELERHDSAADDRYPHHDPATHPAPHGLLNGPDNCLPLGQYLYAVAKDNSLLVRYDLTALADDPDAPPPPGEVIMDADVDVEGLGPQTYTGQSALAYHDGWLYIAYRTSSVILRIPLDELHDPITPIRAQLVARFDPYDPDTHKSPDLTDMTFDDAGRLYVVSAKPARIFRFTPDPADVLDARTTTQHPEQPWLDLAAALDHPKMKSENVLAHDGWLYITSGDAYAYQKGADGAVYRVRLDE